MQEAAIMIQSGPIDLTTGEQALRGFASCKRYLQQKAEVQIVAGQQLSACIGYFCADISMPWGRLTATHTTA